MEASAVKILPSLLIIALMASCVVADKFSMKNKNGNKGGALSTKNSTKEDCNQDGTGSRRTYVYVLNDPNQECYTQFFIGRKAPVGLRNVDNLQTVRYLCQPPRPNQQQNLQRTYYATMFDELYGIAVFSAYKLSGENINFGEVEDKGGEWCETPGIEKQGSKIKYNNQAYKILGKNYVSSPKYNRGHLVPAGTLSSSPEGYLSTYTYTNAVPQDTDFNSGQWNVFEGKIREHASKKCIPAGGTLFLLTGTSFAHVEPGTPPQVKKNPKIKTLLNNQNNPADIYIPNSMWTAGCCALKNGYAESFAVIGNNEQQPNSRQITLADLQKILLEDVTTQGRNIGGPKVDLFPGNDKCIKVDANL